MNRIISAKRASGWWLVEPFRHAPLIEAGKTKYGEDIAGPFDSLQDLEDYYIRMDYIYE